MTGVIAGMANKPRNNLAVSGTVPQCSPPLVTASFLILDEKQIKNFNRQFHDFG
jgi:hypothetical protein